MSHKDYDQMRTYEEAFHLVVKAFLLVEEASSSA
jgi:hypothetical protein